MAKQKNIEAPPLDSLVHREEGERGAPLWVLLGRSERRPRDHLISAPESFQVAVGKVEAAAVRHPTARVLAFLHDHRVLVSEPSCGAEAFSVHATSRGDVTGSTEMRHKGQ